MLPFSLSASGYYIQTPHDILENKDVVDSYQEKHYGFAFGGTLNLGNIAGLYGDLRLERLNTTSLGLFDEHGFTQLTLLRFGAGLDTVDDWFFPRTGLRLDAHVEEGLRIMWGNLEYTKLQGSADAYLPLTGHNVLHLAGVAAYGWDLPRYLLFFAGGQNHLLQASSPMPGYRLNELWGKDLWTATAEFRHEFPWSGLGLVDASYLYVVYGVAGVRLPEIQGSDVFTDVPYKFFQGGAVGYALATRFGPIRVSIGAGQDGRVTWSLSLGPDF